ncbi:hypothetical protein [Haloarchaeobius sp. DFWS5]|uniref:hypothetical protein n=1 Tax=Haloarchaeobius sp. DFWS5 TaxID=3446114 RepID=UPI003EB8C899
MTFEVATGWRTYLRDLLIVFGVLVFFSLVFAGYDTFSILAMQAARVTRDMFFTDLNDELGLYALAGVYLLLEALVITTGVYLVRRRLARLLRPSPPTTP